MKESWQNKNISRLKGQKTVGICSFVANFIQQFFGNNPVIKERQ
jgi:hypothetical protein